MKKIKYIFLAAVLGLSVTLSSCIEMDLFPRGELDDMVLFRSDHGIRTYFAIIYHNLPIENWQFDPQRGYARGSNNVWEHFRDNTAGGFEAVVQNFRNNFGFDIWDGGGMPAWQMIRRINHFLHLMPDMHAYHSEEALQGFIAEARFLRAWFYFAMVRHYGGVPIIDYVLDPALGETDPTALQHPRATERETWEFIYNDLRFAMDHLPANQGGTSRANRYVAAALMSRAMLHAASIANFSDYVALTGQAWQTGLQGMRRSEAATFYQRVIDAADFISNGTGGYRLHTEANLEQAFVNIFATRTAENIFIVPGASVATGGIFEWNFWNNWDVMVLPEYAGINDHGMSIHPTWQLLSLFDVPAIYEPNADGGIVPIRFECRNEFWNTPCRVSGRLMEPRARATFFFSGMHVNNPFPGINGGQPVELDIQAGVFRTLGSHTVEELTPPMETNDLMGDGSVAGNNPGIRIIRAGGGQGTAHNAINVAANTHDIPGHGPTQIIGRHGVNWNASFSSNTGFVIRKMVDPNAIPINRSSIQGGSQDWIVFRYAEIILNRAEALMELGLLNGDEAMQARAFDENHIGAIRQRAGAPPLAFIPGGGAEVGYLVESLYPICENRQNVRNERKRELAFEHHTWFDLRRWRVFHTLFTQFRPRGILPYYILDENKWVFLPQLATRHGGPNYNAGRMSYWRQIPGHAIARNPQLIRNDDN